MFLGWDCVNKFYSPKFSNLSWSNLLPGSDLKIEPRSWILTQNCNKKPVQKPLTSTLGDLAILGHFRLLSYIWHPKYQYPHLARLPTISSPSQNDPPSISSPTKDKPLHSPLHPKWAPSNHLTWQECPPHFARPFFETPCTLSMYIAYSVEGDSSTRNVFSPCIKC